MIWNRKKGIWNDEEFSPSNFRPLHGIQSQPNNRNGKLLPLETRQFANWATLCVLATQALFLLSFFVDATSGMSTRLTDSSLSADADAKPHSEFRAKIGFAGKIKLGSWTPLFFEFSDSHDPESFEAVALDGNGIPVTFSGQVIEKHPGRGQGWVKIGRSFGSVEIRLFGEGRQLIAQTTIDLDRSPDIAILESTTPLLLTIETENQVADDVKSIETLLFGGGSDVVSINRAVDLPASSLAYQGIHIVYLTTSNSELVNAISADQYAALDRWVTNGGKLVFAAGSNAKDVFADPEKLARFLPGQFGGTFDIKKSSPFENYTRSRSPLLERGAAPIKATIVTDPIGVSEMSISQNPVILRRPYHFGQIVFSAVDFDTDPIRKWSGRKNFLLKLTFGRLNLNRTQASESESRSIVQYGYRDVLGQLVFPLEKFSRVRFVNFTIVALLIALFILCIGPGDYLFLRRIVGKMEWTWLTFTLVATGFCGIAIFMSGATKPNDVQVNQLEIVDIDAVESSIRGNVWSNIYCPSNERFDVSVTTKKSLGLETNDATISWLGIPGTGLGSMQSKTGAGLLLQGYGCEFTSGKNPASRLRQLPLTVASTKTLHTQYSGMCDFEFRSRLRLNARSNRIVGSFTNPFAHELKNCRLVFENWVYVLDATLDPGETVDVMSEMKELTATSYFSRRKESDSDKGGNLPWNPQEDSLNRIAEMMMFFELAGGTQYTGMSHTYQPFVDLSELTALRRAVMIGSVDDIQTELNISGNAQTVEYDQHRTFVRIILPVAHN